MSRGEHMAKTDKPNLELFPILTRFPPQSHGHCPVVEDWRLVGVRDGRLSAAAALLQRKGVHDSSGCSLRILQSVPAGPVFAMQQPEAIFSSR